MIEVKNLTKIYKPKKGVPVRALDGVSLTFPENGMVFLLGKSGSGKSTLLNLIGGLDRYDEGEIVIKGVSSKDFKQSHFDSYRNTYLGFIFQEYNILEEFTVGANIALALELQGRRATDGEINTILREVELDGYGTRRPNELSGGQKQRVAIARALVKSPKIIMADEPTGALDSVTGKQVLHTLKKLSRDKLVIVVSHDREFANEYADRIIELADGRVISDTTVDHSGEEIATEGISFDGATVVIPQGYRLTEEDREAINRYLDSLENGLTLDMLRKSSRKFKKTDESKIKYEDTSPFKLIKSKLSLKHAFKIGASGLKHKKFRLTMTVILSVIAFVMFGLVDTFSSYNHPRATANSIYDSGIRYATVQKATLRGEGIDSYWSTHRNRMNDAELEKLSAETGVDFKGVITDNGSGYQIENIVPDTYDSSAQLDIFSFSGIAEIAESDIVSHGFELVAGRLPDGSGKEVAVSSYVLDSFKKYGYTELKPDGEGNTYYANASAVSINSESDLIGKTLDVDGEMTVTVVGIVDTKFDLSRYLSVTEDDGTKTDGEIILDYVLLTELKSARDNDYTGMLMMGEGALDRISSSVHKLDGSLFFDYTDSGFNAEGIIKQSDIESEITWLSGEPRTLSENEILLSSNYFTEGYFYPVKEDIEDFLRTNELTMTYYGDNRITRQVRVVGYYDSDGENKSLRTTVALCDSDVDLIIGDNPGKYDIAIGTMPDSRNDIEHLAEYCYESSDSVRYELQNPASFELDSLDEIIDTLADVFIWVGLFFCVFASILLSNFIATSISYKKQEIGILRAIGSRGNDVFRIFFSESFVIAMINFTLACIGTGVVTSAINSALRDSLGILMTVLDFGIRQILILFVISVAVAWIASFLPVKKIASKRPIDAIRNR